MEKAGDCAVLPGGKPLLCLQSRGKHAPFTKLSIQYGIGWRRYVSMACPAHVRGIGFSSHRFF